MRHKPQGACSRVKAFAFPALVATTLAISSPGALASWVWEFPKPQGNNLNAIVSDQSGFFVVGRWDILGESTNGTNWQFRHLGAPVTVHRELYGAAIGNGLLAVTDGKRVFTTMDRSKWTTVVVPSAKLPNIEAHIHTLAYAGGKFWAFDGNGYHFESIDARRWSGGISLDGAICRGVAFGESTYVLVKDGGRIWTSGNGIDWEKRLSFTESNFVGVDFAFGRFIAITQRGDVLSSQDGRLWETASHLSYPRQDFEPRSIHSTSRGVYCLSRLGHALRTTDGIQWSPVTLPEPFRLWRLASSKDRVVAITADGQLLTSSNGSDFVLLGEIGSRKHINSIALSPSGAAIACGPNGTIMARSPSAAWASMWEPDESDFGHCAWISGSFFVFSGNRKILRSPTGLDWTEGAISLDARSSASGNGITVAIVPGLSEIWSTYNGNQWQRTFQSLGYSINAVSWTGKSFIAIGDAAFLSADGAHWERHSNETVRNLVGSRAIASSGGITVAATRDGRIGVTQDGIQWESRWLLPGYAFQHLYAGHSGFIASASYGGSGTPIVGFSRDGRTWTFSQCPLGNGVNAFVGMPDGRLIAAGFDGIASTISPLGSSDGGQLRIEFAQESGAATLRWSSEFARVVLETATIVSPNGDWTPLYHQASLVESDWNVFLPTTDPAQFFRLRRVD